jgi:hypothetical protein
VLGELERSDVQRQVAHLRQGTRRDGLDSTARRADAASSYQGASNAVTAQRSDGRAGAALGATQPSLASSYATAAAKMAMTRMGTAVCLEAGIQRL